MAEMAYHSCAAMIAQLRAEVACVLDNASRTLLSAIICHGAGGKRRALINTCK
jgi:hypothetical protein